MFNPSNLSKIMAKNNKGGDKSQKKVQNPPVNTATVETPAVEKEPMTPALAEITLGQIIKGEANGLDANHMVDLNGQIVEIFVKNQRAKDMFSENVVEGMTKIAAIGCISAVADAVVRGDSTFALMIKKNAYADFAAVANTMGVKMPALNALPAPDANGNVAVTTASVKVSSNTKEVVKKEQKTLQEGDSGQYEMDPTKLVEMGEEELKKSLNYLFLTNKNKKNSTLNATFAEGVDFMKKFRFAEAEKAENKDEAVAKLNDRNMFQWVEDIMSYIDPSLYFSSVAKATLGAMRGSNSPLSAFTTFRSMLTTGTGKEGPTWSDQEIVDALCAILRWEIFNEIKAEENGKAALDKKARGYRESAKVYEDKIAELNGILEKLSDPDFAIVEKFGTPEGDEDSRLMGLARIITKFYYADCKPEKHYKNLDENIRQHMGIILNMFRAPGNKNQMYSEANLTDIQEYTAEEWKEYQEKAVKAAEEARENLEEKKAELKKAQAEREAKNAQKKD